MSNAMLQQGDTYLLRCKNKACSTMELMDSELTYDPELRFAELVKINALELGHELSAVPADDFTTITYACGFPVQLTSNNLGHKDWLTLHKGELVGSEQPAAGHYELIEQRLGLEKGVIFTTLRSVLEEGTATEHPWDPLKRYSSMAKLHKQPKGAKSYEHCEILRTSDPTYGSLAPSVDRPSKHEVSFDPLKRYTALAPSLRLPRGAKSYEHCEILRTSDPTHDLKQLRLRTVEVDLSSLPRPLSSLRRNESTNSFVCDEDEDVAELPDTESWETRLALGRAWRKARALEDGDADSERASERSAARTGERISVDTVDDLDDTWSLTDGSDMGGFSPRDIDSPCRWPSEFSKMKAVSKAEASPKKGKAEAGLKNKKVDFNMSSVAGGASQRAQ